MSPAALPRLDLDATDPVRRQCERPEPPKVFRDGPTARRLRQHQRRGVDSDRIAVDGGLQAKKKLALAGCQHVLRVAQEVEAELALTQQGARDRHERPHIVDSHEPLELALGKQVSTRLLGAHQELAFRVGKMRKKFAGQYGFVVPEIKVSDDIAIPDKSYQIRIHGTTIASNIASMVSRETALSKSGWSRKCESRRPA